MKKTYLTAITIGLLALPAAQDAKTVIANASKAIGADAVTSITFYGQAASFFLGQSNNANGPWPRTNLDDYRRSIDFSRAALRATGQVYIETHDRRTVTFTTPVPGGPAVQGTFQQVASAANTAWAEHLDIWVSPWGFLKGAASNSATARAQTIGGARYNVVTWHTPQKAPSGIPYKVVGYINVQTNMIDKVDTWLENPIFGDMLVETRYSLWRDAQNNSAVKFPAGIVQERGGFPTFEAQLLSAEVNPGNIEALLTPSPPPDGPGSPGGASAQVVSQSEKLADGVYRIFGDYNAVAVEFMDHILLFEAAVQNEARSAANIAEAKRVIPNKPIRYAVLTHHHFDHTSGIAAVVAEGARIVSHESTVTLFQRALAAPRTLAPDAMSKSGKKPIFDPVVGDQRVFEDATRRVELHVMKGLPHADGMLMLYLPKEKIMAYADTYSAPPAGQIAPRIVDVDVMMATVRRLGMNFDRVVSIHAPIPDRPITRAEIEASLSTGTP
jgi:glyoxylase-like metal-dependent hydrolase (beta-lactamase superfamily II)